ncbi:MAG: hypothetical protein IJO74_02905 [Clostridia bacterium]|nr:hypothetical protein [Clostridia bacterium]
MKTAYQYNKELMKDIVPSMSYTGGDFNEWKIKARQKLSSLLGIDRFEKTLPGLEFEFEEKHEDFTETRFTFNTENGFRSVAHLLIPNGVEKPPVMICLQGHSKGMHVSLGRTRFEGEEQPDISDDKVFAIRAIREGFAAVVLEQRNFGELGGSKNGPGCYDSTMTALLLGRTTLGERVWDIMRLIDVIETSFEDKVDINCICCMGNSGGGTATAYTAALDDRIKLAMPSSAMSTYKDSIGAMYHCSCNYVPGVAAWFEMGDLIAMAYPKLYIQVSGNQDPIFPLDGARSVFEKGKSVYRSMGDGNKCMMVEGDGGHRFYADDSWPIVHKLTGR